jgi:hypothetical protein
MTDSATKRQMMRAARKALGALLSARFEHSLGIQNTIRVCREAMLSIAGITSGEERAAAAAELRATARILQDSADALERPLS